MLCDQLINGLVSGVPSRTWLRQFDPEIARNDQLETVRQQKQSLRHRHRLRRMQRQNFIVRTAYSFVELFQTFAPSSRAS